MEIESIAQIISDTCGAHVIESQEINTTPQGLQIKPDEIAPVCLALHENEATFFDLLSCLSALDNGTEANTIDIVYNLYSIPYDLHLTLKCTIARNTDPMPQIPTVSHIWQTANWHEREAFDLVGVYFTGHPDMRRILLPADWEGHPLRKDYETQDYYHGIKVDY